MTEGMPVAGRDTSEQGHLTEPKPRRGRLGLMVVAALLSGLALAVVVVVAPVIPPRGTSLTGAVLMAFGLGWAMLALLSIRFTDQPQRWAAAPAAFLVLAAGAVWGSVPSADTVVSWVWPLLLLGIVAWVLPSVRRELPSRPGRWLVYPVITALGLAALGGGYATVSSTLQARAQRMPGVLVDVGEHRLHLQCTGSGAPTVVLEPGLGGASTDLHWISSALEVDTRVCVYDRAGRGWSDDADGPQDAAHIAADLHTLLGRAAVPGPYVLAGHSFGGLYILSFAAQFPDEVAGLVLLDSTAPSDTSETHPASFFSRIATVMPGIGYLGAGRDVGSFLQEFLEGSASVQQAAALTDLHGKPIFVVTADTGHDAAWRSAQRQLATLSTNSQQRTAHATHQSLVDDRVASAAASDAIRDVVLSLRTSQAHQRR